MIKAGNYAALFMKYAFYFILLLIFAGFVAEIMESAELITNKLSADIFKYVLWILCFSPLITALIYVVINLFEKSFKHVLLGLCLIAVIILSFLMKSLI